MCIYVTHSPENGYCAEIIISYDIDAENFFVTFSETGCGYLVPRSNLVGDYRNFGEVMRQILCDYEEPFEVFVDEAATNEINIIWEANIILF